MPNYLIREIDATQPSSYTGENNVVVIPGFKGEDGTAKIGEFILVSSVAEFTTLFGSKPALIGTEKVEDKSWIMAWELLNLGMQVIYCAVVENNAEAASATSISNLKAKLETQEFWAPLADRSLYDFRFLTSGAYCADALVTPIQKITKATKVYLRSAEDDTVATSEGAVLNFCAWKYTPAKIDASNKIEFLYTLTTKLPTSVYTYTIENGVATKGAALKANEIVEDAGNQASQIAAQMLNIANVIIANGVQKGRGDIVVIIDRQSGTTSAVEVSDDYQVIGELQGAEYATGFTPWCNINTICPHNADAKNVVLLPPSYAYLAAYAQATQFAPSWNAVAGSARGIIPNLVSPEFKFGEVDANVLMSRLGTKVSVNPICQVRPFGFIIWGNRTLKPNKGIAENAEGLTATSFLNVRNLICSIKKTLYAASRKFTFEQNTNTLWINFKAAVTPLLDRLVTGNGISSYSLRREATTDKAKLKAIISIRAIEAVEDFDLTVYVTDTVEAIE